MSNSSNSPATLKLGKQVSIAEIKPNTPYFIMRAEQRNGNHDYLCSEYSGEGDIQKAYYGVEYPHDMSQIFFTENPLEKKARMYIWRDNVKYLKPNRDSVQEVECLWVKDGHPFPTKELEVNAEETGNKNFLLYSLNRGTKMYFKDKNRPWSKFVTLLPLSEGAIPFIIFEAR